MASDMHGDPLVACDLASARQTRGEDAWLRRSGRPGSRAMSDRPSHGRGSMAALVLLIQDTRLGIPERRQAVSRDPPDVAAGPVARSTCFFDAAVFVLAGRGWLVRDWAQYGRGLGENGCAGVSAAASRPSGEILERADDLLMLDEALAAVRASALGSLVWWLVRLELARRR